MSISAGAEDNNEPDKRVILVLQVHQCYFYHNMMINTSLKLHFNTNFNINNNY